MVFELSRGLSEICWTESKKSHKKLSPPLNSVRGGFLIHLKLSLTIPLFAVDWNADKESVAPWKGIMVKTKDRPSPTKTKTPSIFKNMHFRLLYRIEEIEGTHDSAERAQEAQDAQEVMDKLNRANASIARALQDRNFRKFFNTHIRKNNDLFGKDPAEAFLKKRGMVRRVKTFGYYNIQGTISLCIHEERFLLACHQYSDDLEMTYLVPESDFKHYFDGRALHDYLTTILTPAGVMETLTVFFLLYERARQRDPLG